MATTNRTIGGLEIHAPAAPGHGVVLTPPALEFVADLARRFGGRVAELLARRRERQARFDAGERPHFLSETAAIREGSWTVAPLPTDLLDRRVEITGPVDRKMIINALNSGANVFMADFEDSNAPTWDNVVEGQLNLSDAVDGSIRYVQPGSGKVYTLGPRGGHADGLSAGADKLREVGDGHDGTWVAHPGLVALAREVFDAHMTTPNQIHVKREDVHVTAQDLLRVPQGTRTEAGLRHNVRVGVQYLESWLRGSGCVPLYDLMEDAATAEISRTQVWQWIHHRATLDDGRPLTVERFRSRGRFVHGASGADGYTPPTRDIEGPPHEEPGARVLGRVGRLGPGRDGLVHLRAGDGARPAGAASPLRHPRHA